MSVLAHVVHGAQQPEPAATQALTYILKSNLVLTRSAVDLLRIANIEFEPGRVDAEQVFEDSKPDLTIYDEDGRLRMFIENKFWAGLTKAQPVSYLNKLPQDIPSALVFIVPYQRVPTVWSELEQRCHNNGFEWNGNRLEYTATVNDKKLLVVSWNKFLEKLLYTANIEGLDSAKNDLTQLQGLVNSVNIGAFLPLQADEVHNQEIPNRLINYIDLIHPIIGKLKEANIADTDGLAFSAGTYETGHYFRLHAKNIFDCWIGIPLKRWCDKGFSPMWCRIRGHGLNVSHFEKVPHLFKDVLMDGVNVRIPIRLKTGVEQDEVIEDVAQQINRIVEEVLKTISN